MANYPPTLFSCRDLATTPAAVAAAAADPRKDPGPAFRLLSLDTRSIGQPKYAYRSEFCGPDGTLALYLKLADPAAPAGDRKPGNVLRQQRHDDGTITWEPLAIGDYLAADEGGIGFFMAPRKEKDGTVARWPEGDVKVESKWEFLVARTVQLDQVRALARQTGKRAGQVIATDNRFDVWFRPSVDRQLREWLATAKLQNPDREPTTAWFRLIYDEKAGPQDRYKLVFAGWERPPNPDAEALRIAEAVLTGVPLPSKKQAAVDDDPPPPPVPDDPTIGVPGEEISAERMLGRNMLRC